MTVIVIDHVVMATVHAAVESLMARVAASSSRHAKPEPRVVAVSKTKQVEVIRSAYDKGIRHFGENYVQELAEKASHPLLSSLGDICWHFIGHLQRNKCNLLLSVPHLWIVETVNSAKLASSLDSSWHRKCCNEHTCESSKLRVMIQVNTSREESKHGCLPETAVDLARHVHLSCHHLQFCGLMVIGNKDSSQHDFTLLTRIKEDLCTSLALKSEQVELSMGMSNDFEEAIAFGSTSIRIGRSLFGERTPK